MPPYRTIPRTCEVCGAGFLGRASIVRLGKARYCGETCRNAGRSRPKPTTAKLPRICERCGATSLKAPSAIAAGRGRFCSRACAHAGQSAGLMVTCETCGETFRRKPSAVFARVYCSHPCRLAASPAPAILSDDGLTARVPLQARDGSITGYTLVDAADVAWAQQWRWQMSPTRRVVRGRNGRTIHLHRELLGLVKGDGLEADHINRDTLDNRRANLRKATRGQNAQNLPIRMNASSAHRGVSWVARRQKWWAYCNVGGERVYSEFFETEQEAADAARAARARFLPYATN